MATFAILIKLAISTATQEMEQLEKNAPLMNRVSASSVLGAVIYMKRRNCVLNMHKDTALKDQNASKCILGLLQKKNKKSLVSSEQLIIIMHMMSLAKKCQKLIK